MIFVLCCGEDSLHTWESIWREQSISSTGTIVLKFLGKPINDDTREALLNEDRGVFVPLLSLCVLMPNVLFNAIHIFSALSLQRQTCPHSTFARSMIPNYFQQ